MIDTRHYAAPDKLKDGTPVVVRSIRGQDREPIAAAFKSTDPQSVYMRFFTHKKELSDAELTQLTEVDPDHVVALVATPGGEDGELLGGGRYCSDETLKVARTGELAFMTADQHHGRGIASMLLRHLIHIARAEGLANFHADVLAHNQSMLSVFRNSGLAMSQRTEAGVIHVSLSLV
jgi:GNAT superfamily N-acetyltransferase